MGDGALTHAAGHENGRSWGMGMTLAKRAYRGRLWVRAVLALGLVIGLAACAETFRDHGFVPPQEELDAVTIGRDTRASLAETLGRPSAEGVMGEATWFYSQYRVRTYAWRAPEVISRDIVAVSFADNGTVSNVESFTLADGRVVELSRRVTGSSIREISLLRQILGNFGRVNLGDLTGG